MNLNDLLFFCFLEEAIVKQGKKKQHFIDFNQHTPLGIGKIKYTICTYEESAIIRVEIQ